MNGRNNSKVIPHNLIWVFDEHIPSSRKVGDVGRLGSLSKPLVFGIELGCGTPQILRFEQINREKQRKKGGKIL
ncbi:hypothetical protein TorRG33x02_144460, partial [Trema orientale]